MNHWRNAAAAMFGAVLSLSVAPQASAESGAGPEAMVMGNMCMVMFGYDMIHITATQPDKSRSEYCSEIPSTGKTVMVFDIENTKYRDYPLELRIIKDPLRPISADEDLGPITELHFPAKAYTRGTFNFEHDFKEAGHYIGLVTITREDGRKETSDFRFTVGETLWGWVPQIAGAILIAGMVAAYWHHTHPGGKKKKESADAPAS